MKTRIPPRYLKEDLSIIVAGDFDHTPRQTGLSFTAHSLAALRVRFPKAEMLLACRNAPSSSSSFFKRPALPPCDDISSLADYLSLAKTGLRAATSSSVLLLHSGVLLSCPNIIGLASTLPPPSTSSKIFSRRITTLTYPRLYSRQRSALPAINTALVYGRTSDLYELLLNDDLPFMSLSLSDKASPILEANIAAFSPRAARASLSETSKAVFAQSPPNQSAGLARRSSSRAVAPQITESDAP